MKSEMRKLTERHRDERNPEERAHLKREMDQIPVSPGELEQVHQREIDRKANDIRVFHKSR